MARRADGRPVTGRRASFAVGPAVAVALVVGACAPVVMPAQVAGATGPNGGMSGTFAPVSPGEVWGGGNQAEKCVTCSAASLLKEDTAQSIQSGQSVDPANGDFSTHLGLFSATTAAGTFGLSLTYDAQRSIVEAIDPSQYPYQHPGLFGWGWQSALTASLVSSTQTSVYKFNEANGSQIGFRAIGTTADEIHADECPWQGGDYPDWQKSTVPGSTEAFCAASRVDAQLGTVSNFDTYHVLAGGGSEDLTFDYFGQLTREGNVQNPNAVGIAYGVSQETTSCPRTPTHATTTCDVETDLVAEGSQITRRIVTELDGFGVATAVFAPTGAEYALGHNGNTLLTSVTNPTGDVTHFGYAATQGTQSTGYKNDLTSMTDPDGHTTQVAYSTGMVTQLIDPSNQYTVYTYQTRNCATLSGCFKTDSSQATTIKYDDGEVDRDYYDGGVLLTDCYGPTANTCGNGDDWGFNYHFDTGGVAGGTSHETVNIPGGAQATVVTDAADDVTSFTDPNGNRFRYMWNDTAGNDLGELCWSAMPGSTVPANVTCTTPPGRATSSTYNEYGDQVSSTDPHGYTSHSGYYDNGELCWTAPPSVSGGGTCNNGGSSPAGAPAGSTAYVYDPMGNLVQTTVAYGTGTAQTTTSTYDLAGRATATIPPDGQGHGGFGANPYETTATYRASGLVRQTTAPMSDKTTYAYDGDGQVVTETDPGGVTTTTYDPEGRVCWTHRGATKITGSCNPGTTGPAGSTTYSYLATTTAPTAATNPDGHITTYSYSDKAYPTEATKVQDPAGNETQYKTYTLFGRGCISGPVNPGSAPCGSPVGGDTWSEYNAEGQLQATADPGGTRTTYAYGDATYPLDPTTVTYGSRTTTYTYNSDGQEIWRTDAEGHGLVTGYNVNGQVCMVSPVGWFPVCTAPTVTGATTYQYNHAGELTKMVDNHGTANAVATTYRYDSDGHLTSATTDNGRTVTYAYNDAGEVSCIGYPVRSGATCANGPSTSNTVVDRTYDAAGQLTKTTDWLGHSIGYSGYTPNGKLGKITYPSSTGESLTYHYDTAGLMTAADYSGPAVGSAGDSYGHNPDSQLSSLTGLGGFSSPSDTYNDYARVSKATDPTSPSAKVQDTYAYNANGTIASITPASGPTQTDTYNTVEELTTQSQPVTGGSATTPEPGTPITVGTHPAAVAVNPAGTKAYVANAGSNTVTPVTVSSGTAGTAISAGTGPDAIAVNPAGTKAYVADGGSKKVTPITLSSGTAGTAISAGTGPDAIAVNPAGTKAYVANAGSNTVTPITLSSGTAGTPITVGKHPDGIAITPNGAKAYVANELSTTVTPITLSSGTAGTGISVEHEGAAIAINPAGTKAYLTTSFLTAADQLTTITLASGTDVAHLSLGNRFADAVAVNPAGTKAYVVETTTNSNTGGNAVVPVTLTYDTAGTAVSMGSGPDGIAFVPSGTKFYVPERGATKVEPVTLKNTTLTPHDAYNADGQRCWSAQTEVAAPCTRAPSGATSYGWNVLGQLCWSGSTTATGAACTAPPAGTTTYRTNGFGLRTKETPPSGSALAFTYDMVSGGSVPEDIDDGTNAYVYGPTPSAPAEQVNLSTGAVDYLATSQSGVQAVFNGSGSLQEEATYSTYGTQVIEQGSKVTPFGFQGTYSTSSGLDYMVNRYYTPKDAQFLSVDPELTSTHEPYAFGGGDPLNETDPLGLTWFWSYTHTTWYTYAPGSLKAQLHGMECGTPFGLGTNETSGNHCGSKWCSGNGLCTAGAAKAFDLSYGTSLPPAEPTNTVAIFLQTMANFTAYINAGLANQQPQPAAPHRVPTVNRVGAPTTTGAPKNLHDLHQDKKNDDQNETISGGSCDSSEAGSIIDGTGEAYQCESRTHSNDIVIWIYVGVGPYSSVPTPSPLDIYGDGGSDLIPVW
ncbi:MAG: RHS repeat-associated core domain-containing protein [Acidimicrobiales bacterium]